LQAGIRKRGDAMVRQSRQGVEAGSPRCRCRWWWQWHGAGGGGGGGGGEVVSLLHRSIVAMAALCVMLSQ